MPETTGASAAPPSRAPRSRQATTLSDCWFLTGPTASGKTTIGLELAGLINAEIVSLDSMAIYRHLDISTAKPTREQRTQIPHHLLDIVEPNEEYSLANYVAAAESCVRQLSQRGGLVAVALWAILFVIVEPFPFSGLLLFVASMSAAIFSVFGDLFESSMKRSAGIKESGAILPGHGGILDRIDSLLAAVPVFVFIVALGI